MKTIILIWLVAQLIVIGVVLVNGINEAQDGTYECMTEEEIRGFRAPSWIGIAMPLIFFADTPRYISDYCDEKREKLNENYEN